MPFKEEKSLSSLRLVGTVATPDVKSKTDNKLWISRFCIKVKMLTQSPKLFTTNEDEPQRGSKTLFIDS